MSDLETSPNKIRSRDTLQIDDYSYQDREPKCINSLCNLINSRLKVLENEILAQHKVWESIQKEVDEVKSLIEDCTSTCGSSSSSGQEHESENVDSAVESHKTCNSLYWGKIKQAEENVEEKKSLMRRLSSDVIKLRNSKKKCNRRHTKSKSSIDLILEVTNGLHVLKCDDCKFCSEHLDFREGLLSAVIELIHFTEKNYSNSLEENKALKSCLQKIYVKTKSCLLHSQIYLKSNQNHLHLDAESHSVCVDNIYTSFEEFCQHFQNLQDELLQLRQILLAAEENHLDELFQDSHSSNCICFNFVKKGESHSSNDSDKIEAKFSKTSQKHLCDYEKKFKTLTYSDEPDDDPDTLFDSDHIFKLHENHANKQLETLRSRIYEAVRTIRDVEVEENDDANLVSMVTSLAEECGALRQEVSYLRNVRQEKKRSWSKLQCFIMDAERKLKGNRNISEIKEVLSDLRQIISSSESSSLDETVLYMYSNQLEWMEKHEATAPGKAEASLDPDLRKNVDCTDVSIQTCVPPYENASRGYTSEIDFIDSQKYDIGIQVEDVFNFYSTGSSKPFSSSFSEINREIYVVPEVMEECDTCFSSSSLDNKIDDSSQLLESFNTQDDIENVESKHLEKVQDDFERQCDSLETGCKALMTSSNIAGIFQFDIDELMPQHSSKNFSLAPSSLSDISLCSNKTSFLDSIFDQQSPFNNPLCKSMFLYMFLNHRIDISHKLNNIVFHVVNNDLQTVEIMGETENFKFIVLKTENTLPVTASQPLKHLPYQSASVADDTVVEEAVDNANYSENICRNVILNSSTEPISSSNSLENRSMPNDSLCEKKVIDIHNAAPPSSEKSDHTESQAELHSAEDCPECLKGDCHSSVEDKNVVERPALPCREGTFIVESSESLGIRKPKVFDENMYYTAILTTLVSSDIKPPEKNYVLFEIRKSLKDSDAEFQCDEEGSEGSVEGKHNVQHFVLCETDKTKTQETATDICHIIFCKSNAKFENKLFDISSGNNSSFNPLVPQYLPLGMNYESCETLPLTHNCEIYTCDTTMNADSENENSVFMPKNYFRFKKSSPSTTISQYQVLDSSMHMQYMTAFSEPFPLKSVEMTPTGSNEESNRQKNRDSCEDSPERREMSSQTDESHKRILQESMEHSIIANCGTQTIGNVSNIIELTADYAEPSDERGYLHEDIENEDEMKYNSAQPEHVLREISLLDEIAALKENLGHQNAVLQRLKEDLEDSQLKIEEKESRLQMLQMEHSRLNEIIMQSNIKEVEDKRCQTESTSVEETDKLKKEVYSLRKENMLNQEKIVQQNKTIEHVKAQLCSSISHLKTLKDSASKQLKRQKNQIIKSFKVKQQLQETKLALEKRCEEIEKKNELISDQEFQLHEIQSRLDTTIEELNKKQQGVRKQSIIIRVDAETQTTGMTGRSENGTENDRKTVKKLLPVTEQDIMLKKHSEELIELQTKLLHLESIFSNKKEYGRHAYEENLHKSSNDLKVPSYLKEGNIWKLLMISEQSYLSLISKLCDSLQISDLKGSVTLMHTSWLNTDELADARRQDHKKILLSLDKLKRSIRYLQETHHQEQRRQNAESAGSDEKKSSSLCHTDEMHFQYLCEVLQRAQENLLKEYTQKRSSHQRTSGTPSSLRTSRLGNSRERRIPLELKNGRILALLDDKVSQKDLLPNKHDFNKVETKAGTIFKSKSSS